MRTQVIGPPDDDFHHFPRCVFLVFISVVHLRFMLRFFFHIRFAHTCLGFFRTRPDIKLCYAGRFAKRAQYIYIYIFFYIYIYVYIFKKKNIYKKIKHMLYSHDVCNRHLCIIFLMRVLDS